MVEDFDRELAKRLREAGCTPVREGKGSHSVWFSPVSCRTFTVPRGTKSRHTVNKVLKDAGLPKAF